MAHHIDESQVVPCKVNDTVLVLYDRQATIDILDRPEVVTDVSTSVTVSKLATSDREGNEIRSGSGNPGLLRSAKE
jgi:hypothetical protein